MILVPKEEESILLTSGSYMNLYLGESPMVVLISPVLDSINYHSWSKSMLTTLSAKNKFQFVNGSIMKLAMQSYVLSWIVHSVSPYIKQSILWMERNMVG